MAPVRAQNDERQSVTIVSSTKRLLHIGNRICGWLEQLAIRAGFGGAGTTDKEARAYCEHDYT